MCGVWTYEQFARDVRSSPYRRVATRGAARGLAHEPVVVAAAAAVRELLALTRLAEEKIHFKP